MAPGILHDLREQVTPRLHLLHLSLPPLMMTIPALLPGLVPTRLVVALVELAVTVRCSYNNGKVLEMCGMLMLKRIGPDYCGKGCQSNCDAQAECGKYAAEPGKKCPLNVWYVCLLLNFCLFPLCYWL